MTQIRPVGLFERLGVEIEYMIVDGESLAVRPITDQVIHAVAGEYRNEVERGAVAWSNELVLHVIELKTAAPARSCDGVAASFQRNVEEINALLKPMGARLLPTAMHPWMNPSRETVLWPHENNAIYNAFNRIFDCQGHGWSNLQSTHLNLPFADDREFARLHAAVRLLLPILPALTASSPLVEGRLTGFLDNRLEAYRGNCSRIPSITGRVIPEAVFSAGAYEEEILGKMYADIGTYDPEGILRYEWLNARGAIARFERNTIEIRVLDTQECPAADLAVVEMIVAVLKALVSERWTTLESQQSWEVAPLEAIFLATVADAESAVINDRRYLEVWGMRDTAACAAGDIWRHLLRALWSEGTIPAALTHIVEQGSLARRIVTALHRGGSRAEVEAVYTELCDCLDQGRLFGV